MTQEIIVSIHIPKTGGTTLKNILASVYGDNFLWFTETNSHRLAFEKLRNSALEDKLKDIKCIHGHLGFGIHNYLSYMGIKCKYIIFTRSIEDRLLSYFNYINTDAVKSHYKWDNRFGWDNDMSFFDWLSSCKMADQDNSIVRFLSGCDNLNTDPLKYRMCEQDLELAKKNSKELSFVGSMDNFDADIKILANKLSWGIVPEYGKDNANPDHRYGKDLQREERSLILETQKLDFSIQRWLDKARVF